MKIRELQKILDARLLVGSDLDAEVQDACGSDMMSDVLAFAKDQAVLLTGLTNPQAVRTASMMDMVCVVFVRGKQPEQSVLDLAREMNITVLATAHGMFAACGLLYQNGLHGGESTSPSRS